MKTITQFEMPMKLERPLDSSLSLDNLRNQYDEAASNLLKELQAIDLDCFSWIVSSDVTFPKVAEKLVEWLLKGATSREGSEAWRLLMDIKEAEKSLKLNRAINTFKNAEYQLKQTEMQRMNHSTAATPTPKASLPALPTLPGIPTVVPATPPSPLRVAEPPQDDPDEAPLPAPKVEVEADVENPTSNSATSATTGLDSQTSSSVEGNSSAADARRLV